MRGRSVSWLALVLLACSGPAEAPPASVAPPPPTSAPEPEPVPTRPSWLYRIETESQPSYLFAALEPGCPLHESFPAEFEILFRYARTVMVPVVWTEQEEQEFVLAHGMDAGYRLDRELGPERYVPFLEATALPIDAAPRVLPMMGLALFSQNLVADVYGASRTDSRLSPTHDAMTRRRMSGLPLVGSLTADEAAESFERIPRSAALAELRTAIERRRELRAEFAARLEAYRAGDEADVARHDGTRLLAVEAYITALTAEDARLMALSVPRIEAELRAGNALVVMDVDDVVGETGVLARLRADHLALTRVEVPAPAE